MATWGGLQHFDPASGAFRLYLHDPKQPASLASNDINAIAMDARGGVWAATWPVMSSRFQPGAMGSAVFAGRNALGHAHGDGGGRWSGHPPAPGAIA